MKCTRIVDAAVCSAVSSLTQLRLAGHMVAVNMSVTNWTPIVWKAASAKLV